MTTTSPQPAARKGLEVTAVFFAATTAALAAGIVVALCHAQALAVVGAGGVTFSAAFGIGMKVIEYLSRSN
ncbi:hypothetical protein E6R18_33130 [Streptomyces sp. A1277]|uniref:hypothetical protein n=1 Tax=Streptomyces sp. A1277 TaxID=2563103 RepID=UPI0010A2251C|nr:hypothetical protein [Streptomyces sp. A1277]THA22682.1 hypothetical protein E6R18_33130 [Streptomyces sp. A1277]